MGVFKPKIYQKNIFDINYKELKTEGIKCLIFDLDNTLGLISHKNCPDDTKELINKLKKDFIVIIISNNTRKRLKPYLEELGIDGVAWSMKPSIKGLIRVKAKYKLKKKEMCIIGDQIVTDVLAGNRYHIKTILVDPLGEKDLKITGLNRKIESRIVKHYEKRGIFERGKYYE
ncbi:MAG: YqeG family HAD IIIA-type phosphatase [Bacilli bacterium]|nr:YqeG family HAD IIIA-type phosphatase [Bacilli bacterium]